MYRRILLFKILLFTFLNGYIATSARSVQQDNIRISLGKSDISGNESFIITVYATNTAISSIGEFPEIEGFMKLGTSQSQSSISVNGKSRSVISYTTSYRPASEGTFVLKPFSMKINGQSYRSKGTKIRVQNLGNGSQNFSYSPFDYDQQNNNPFLQQSPQDFMEIEADAFLALTTSKNEIFRGEGVTADLSFYVSHENTADMRFYELNNQVNKIAKRVKPENCWEEGANISQVTGEQVTLEGKPYTKYKIFQATFFPFSAEDLYFPQLEFSVIKYDVSRSSSRYGRNKRENYETFKSKPVTIRVKELPAHPLRNSVSVGNFVLNEQIDRTTLETGGGFTYRFDIGGIGNINSISPPGPFDFDGLEIYDPEIRKSIDTRNKRVTGTKFIQYFGNANKAGSYDLGEQIYWIYFNPAKEVYDTLRSTMKLEVTGEDLSSELITIPDPGSFYDKIDAQNNMLVNIQGFKHTRLLINLLVVLMILAVIFVLVSPLVFKKKDLS